jgi:hypothetical protein
MIRAWLVGNVKETWGHEKLRPTLEAAKTDVTPVRTRPSPIETRQVPQDRVKELARDSARLTPPRPSGR